MWLCWCPGMCTAWREVKYVVQQGTYRSESFSLKPLNRIFLNIFNWIVDNNFVMQVNNCVVIVLLPYMNIIRRLYGDSSLPIQLNVKGLKHYSLSSRPSFPPSTKASSPRHILRHPILTPFPTPAIWILSRRRITGHLSPGGIR